MSGFGQTGPDRRRAGVNLIIEAFSGALSVTGEPGEMPMRPGVQTADVFGALFATYATLAGLVGAARHGEGRIADVSLVEASIAAAAWEAAEYLETGQVPQPMGNKHRLTAPYQLFETSDKRYVAIGTPNDRLFAEIHADARSSTQHLADPRFATYAKRKANEDALLPLVEPAIRKMECGPTRNGADDGRRAVRAGQRLPGGVRPPADQGARRGEGGRASPARHDAGGAQSGPVRPRRADDRRPAPMLGEHSEADFAGAGINAADIRKLAETGVTKLGAAPQLVDSRRITSAVIAAARRRRSITSQSSDWMRLRGQDTAYDDR